MLPKPSQPAARAMLEKERRVIRRALFGAEDPLRLDQTSTRNRYLVTDGNQTLEAMVAAGWMRKGARHGEIDRAYHVTPMGAIAAGLADQVLPEHLESGDAPKVGYA